MGFNSRHFKALMRKNAINYKRTCCGSVTEILCPLVIMGIVASIRLADDPKFVKEQSIIGQAAMYSPFTVKDPVTGNYELQMQQSDETIAFRDFIDVDAKYNPLLFFPDHCYSIERELSEEETEDAKEDTTAEDDDEDDDFTKQVNATMIGYILHGNDEEEHFLEQLQLLTSSQYEVSPDYFHDFEYREFADEEEMETYIKDIRYGLDRDKPAMCFGWEIDKTADNKFEMTLRFMDQVEGSPAGSGIQNQNQPSWSPLATTVDFTAFYKYSANGYLFLQNLAANTILRDNIDASGSIETIVTPAKTAPYISDELIASVMDRNFPFLVLCMWIPVIFRLSYRITNEKETRARESMKMMGLTDLSYWASWLCYHFIIVTLISFLCTIAIYINVFQYTSPIITFWYFWLYGMSIFGNVIVLLPFFQKARYAGLFTSIIYFSSAFLDQLVQDKGISMSAKNSASLLQSVALYRMTNVMGVLEGSGIGLNLDNMDVVYQNYKFINGVFFLILDFFIQLALGLYLDKVWPQQFGQQESPFFIFRNCLPSYWDFAPCLRRAIKKSDEQIRAEQLQDANEDYFEGDEIETKYIKKKNFEAPEQKLSDLEVKGKMLKIEDLRKVYDNGFKAVNGVSVRMYENQIFALLGHNGAGKTTTISMLNGLITSTYGRAEVFGKDVFNEMDDVRRFMGVCPQHDVLFDLLTPMEHLYLFYDFKGADPDKKKRKEECEKILKDCQLYYAKDKLAGTLSGGMKRKLSVSIALCGNSKFVLLDEPTSGMDLSARRSLWDMLRSYRQGRIILLTTHYMDEADILGDRIGIMAGGRLVCLGRSLFLKKRYGVGYNLTLVKNDKEENKSIEPYLKENLGDSIVKLSEVSSEITFQIPTELSNKFKEFFSEFDNQLPSLNIESYGISVTTLEEVFLSVGDGGDGKTQIQKDDLMVQDDAKDQDINDYSIAEQNYNNFCRNVAALFYKRVLLYKANISVLMQEVMVPVVLVLIGTSMSKVSYFYNSPPRLLSTDLFPLKQSIIMNKDPYIPVEVDPGYDINSLIFENLPNQTDAFEVDYLDFNKWQELMTKEEINDLVFPGYDFDQEVYEHRLTGSREPYKFGSYYIYEADTSSNSYKVMNYVNTTSQEATVAYPQFMYESLLKTASNDTEFEFTMTTKAYPVLQKFRERETVANAIFLTFVISIGYAFIPTSIISFILQEREKNLKQMQLISGMNLFAYWVVNIIFDIFKTMIPVGCSIALLEIFGIEFETVNVMFLLWPVSVIPFTYATSLIFSSDGNAQFATVFFHFVAMDIGPIAVAILRLIPSTQALGDQLYRQLRILPSFPLTNSIQFEAWKDVITAQREGPNPGGTGDEIDEDIWSMSNAGGDARALIVHGIFWTLILLIFEFNPLGFLCSNLTFCCCLNPKRQTDLVKDNDVVREADRIRDMKTSKQPEKGKLLVKVKDYRKVYNKMFKKGFKAVESIDFGLEFGECFCLLGVNGAGKSTTFKALTNEVVPTNGKITVGGYDINRQFGSARKLIGYCPQYDCIFADMTVEQHLKFYARLKGIMPRLQHRMIEKTIKEMGLEPHRHKRAGTLSGGNKRKLSVGMAIIGNPPVILLDEPSAGMDPEARRFMWSVVAKVSQGKGRSAVVLTTHSMEEAEALSTKMGIMVRGGVFKCFGSAQHIKNKFGTGYEIEVKVSRLNDETSAQLREEFDFYPEQTNISLDELKRKLAEKEFQQLLIDQITETGLGSDLWKEADKEKGIISMQTVLDWINAQRYGQKIIKTLIDEFEHVVLLEQYSDYFKLKVLRGTKTIGFLFGLIEDRKNEFGIAEYSVSQTTLEQIFNQFAMMTYGAKDLRVFKYSEEGQNQNLDGDDGENVKKVELEEMEAAEYEQRYEAVQQVSPVKQLSPQGSESKPLINNSSAQKNDNQGLIEMQNLSKAEDEDNNDLL